RASPRPGRTCRLIASGAPGTAPATALGAAVLLSLAAAGVRLTTLSALARAIAAGPSRLTGTAAAPAAGPAPASLTRGARLCGGSAGLLGSAGRFLRLRGDVVGALTDELGHLGGVGGDLLRGGLDRGLAQQGKGVLALIGGHDRDHIPGAAGTGGAARTVQVGLVLGRRIDVDDEFDGIDVDSAGGDVRGHEHLRISAHERGEVAVAGALGQVAVQVDGRDAGGGELSGEALGPMLGAGEEDPTARARGELVDECVLVID